MSPYDLPDFELRPVHRRWAVRALGAVALSALFFALSLFPPPDWDSMLAPAPEPLTYCALAETASASDAHRLRQFCRDEWWRLEKTGLSAGGAEAMMTRRIERSLRLARAQGAVRDAVVGVQQWGNERHLQLKLLYLLGIFGGAYGFRRARRRNRIRLTADGLFVDGEWVAMEEVAMCVCVDGQIVLAYHYGWVDRFPCSGSPQEGERLAQAIDDLIIPEDERDIAAGRKTEIRRQHQLFDRVRAR